MSITWTCQSWPENLSSGGDRLVTGVPCKGCEPAFTGHDSLPPPQACESVLMWQAWRVAGSGRQMAGIFTKVKVFRLGVIQSQLYCRIHCRTLPMHRISHYSLLVTKFQRGGFQCYAPLLIFSARATYLLLVSSDYRLCVLPGRLSALPDFFRS